MCVGILRVFEIVLNSFGKVFISIEKIGIRQASTAPVLQFIRFQGSDRFQLATHLGAELPFVILVSEITCRGDAGDKQDENENQDSQRAFFLGLEIGQARPALR